MGGVRESPRVTGIHPADLTILEAAAALRADRLTCTDLMAAHLDRIAVRDPTLHAVVALDPDAMDRAVEADGALNSGRDPRPLLGIPFGVKDIIDVAGLPTRCGSHATADRPAAEDAPAVARLRTAGAIPICKLTTYEFAMTGPSFDGLTPPARNPWNLGRVTGGSSSGSAAAVAGGLVRFALGTDTGGSVRSPAAFCGVVGLKPAFGTVPLDSVLPLAPTLDHVGPLVATVAEAALVLAALTGDLTAPHGGPLHTLRIGYARDWFAADPATDPALLAQVDAAARALRTVVAQVLPVALPPYAEIEAEGGILLRAEAFAVHTDPLRTMPKRYGAQVRQSLSEGAAHGPDEVAKARAFSGALGNAVDAALRNLDAILTAVTLALAPPLSPAGTERAVWIPMRTLPFNMTGHPAISVPIGIVDGVPAAIQIVGSKNATATILRIAMAVETLFPPLRAPWPAI